MRRLAFCEFTTMDTTFEEDLALAAEFGLEAVGLCEAKLGDGPDDEQLALFRQSGLRCASVLPSNLSPLPPIPTGLYPGPEDPAERVRLMIASLERLAPFEPETVVYATGAEAGVGLRESERIAVDAFRTVARRAAELGLEISVEPIRYVGFNGSWLRTTRAALEFMDRVGEPNLSLCFDVYHLWDDPEVYDLLAAHGHRIGAVQISDWHEPPRARGDRLIPGEGSIDLPRLFDALEAGGFTRTYDVEIFSDDGRWGTAVPDSVWAMDPREVYRRTITGFTHAWDNRTGGQR